MYEYDRNYTRCRCLDQYYLIFPHQSLIIFIRKIKEVFLFCYFHNIMD